MLPQELIDAIIQFMAPQISIADMSSRDGIMDMFRRLLAAYNITEQLISSAEALLSAGEFEAATDVLTKALGMDRPSCNPRLACVLQQQQGPVLQEVNGLVVKAEAALDPTTVRNLLSQADETIHRACRMLRSNWSSTHHYMSDMRMVPDPNDAYDKPYAVFSMLDAGRRQLGVLEFDVKIKQLVAEAETVLTAGDYYCSKDGNLFKIRSLKATKKQPYLYRGLNRERWWYVQQGETPVRTSRHAYCVLSGSTRRWKI